MLEWLKGKQPVTALMDSFLAEGERGQIRFLMSALNVGEVYYFLQKHHSVRVADTWRELSHTLPITIETPTMADIWVAAALKGKYPISYADAFAAMLAQKYNCPLVTGDPEFRSITGLELDWIER